MQVINWYGDSTLCEGLTTSLSTDSKTNTLLTSVHNDADDTDAMDDADNANDYNRVIGIAQLKAFSCAKNYVNATDINKKTSMAAKLIISVSVI